MTLNNAKRFSKFLTRFYNRMQKKIVLDTKIKKCKKCPGLNRNGTENAPGYGNICSPIFFVGQSLCDMCRLTQIPFTRGSGDLLDEAFFAVGKIKSDFFTTNVVHCHPSGNRPSKPQEILNCRMFLIAELELVKPKAIVTLGGDAKSAINKLVESGELSLLEKVDIINVYHPAYFKHCYSPKKERNWVSDLVEVINDYSSL